VFNKSKPQFLLNIINMRNPKVLGNIIRMIIFVLIVSSCKNETQNEEIKVLFLHHSTGAVLWQGNSSSSLQSLASKISDRLANILAPKGQLQVLFGNYNRVNSKKYIIKEQIFPKSEPYGWQNYPFDYYNIWVKNGGINSYKDEPTLEILTQQYNVIIFKHCFPVSNIKPDQDTVDISSSVKTIANYKLQYEALKEKLYQFPNTRFILFTGAAQVEAAITPDEALRAKEFFNWVLEEWDVENDNIFIWDFYSLQTEGGLYFKNEYAVSPADSHPNKDFAGRVVPLLFNRIIDVLENEGKSTKVNGEQKQF